jgi:coproporphyrinogen III oxidase
MGKSSSPPRGAIIRGLATRKRDIASENVRDIFALGKICDLQGEGKRSGNQQAKPTGLSPTALSKQAATRKANFFPIAAGLHQRRLTMFEQAAAYFRQLQDRICQALEEVDGRARFREDLWDRPGGGGGRTRVLADGAVFEKAGVNFSQVWGEFSEEFARSMPGEGRAFQATGISLVLHPLNPMVPTVHANFRFLCKGDTAWFGGGADLTPYYPYREDVIHFHRVWKTVCERHAPPVDYRRFKQWCDEYFYLPHRREHRGVGGIFFDYLQGDLDKLFAFVRDCGDHFLDAYLPIVRRRKDEPYGERERFFQQVRRGRYVEFNLMYDRGTQFGLKTGGRVESILMSLPPTVRYVYDYHPEPGSREAQLTEYFLIPRNWADEPL